MKRRLFRLVVFLLLGAIVNVGVAWGCAAWVDSSQSGMRPKFASTLTPQGYFWYVRSESARGAERVLSTRLLVRAVHVIGAGDRPSDLIPSWSTISHAFDPAEPKTRDQQMQDARGWPMLSMRCTFLCAGANVVLLSGREVVGGRELPSRTWKGSRISTFTLRALPYIPIPLGFVVNTIFYAAILWLPFAPFQLPRYVRVKRGHCIKCGYDLRGDAGGGCPECGWRREDVP